MITKETKIDQYEIVGEFKIVQIREAIVIKEDGDVISTSFHRRTISPLDDVTNEPQEIKDICNLLHTQEVQDNYTTVTGISGS